MKTPAQQILRIRGGLPLTRGFTLVELLMVITIIGILAALVVGLMAVATKKSRESQVRAMLSELVTAIEAYKTRMGHYPPDNAARPDQPPLFYELLGTYSTDNGVNFTTSDSISTLDTATVTAAFGMPGFVNAAAVVIARAAGRAEHQDGCKNRSNYSRPCLHAVLL